MRLPLTLFAFALIVVTTSWWWMGAPGRLAGTHAADGKVQCLSYAPFRGAQSPLTPRARVERAQIEEDFARLAAVTKCVRTYSIDHGLDQIPAVAEQFGLKVIQGLWLSSDRAKNGSEIDGVVALAKRYPHVITAIVVGNEVLLRGELSANDLSQILRTVKAAVPMPVTYADVWEFWLRNRELAAAADFITIHILPYWEDEPIPAHAAGAHVDAIRQQVGAAFPGRDILIGEVGWPSQGRMRQGALPSPSNQGRVIEDVVARAAQRGYRANLIEAFDQPWKRALEGTVGGYWGLFTGAGREPKFVLGQPVSDHPYWPWQALGGVVLVCLVFAATWRAAGGAADKIRPVIWVAVSLNAVAGGVLAGWAIEKGMVESLGAGGALRSATLALLAIAGPLAGSALLARDDRLPGFARLLGARDERPADPLVLAAGFILILLTLAAIETALGLVFDPRYRDFPFAALTAASIPFLVQRWIGPKGEGSRGVAETAAAWVLAVGAAYIVLNEGVANWQAVWLAASFFALALTLARGRDAQSSKS
ncbi:MAG: glycoside hydrolase family 17 protein [Rhodoplanes sp.]